VQTSHFAIIGGSFVPLLIVRGLGASATLAGAALALRNLAAAATSPLFAVTMIRFGLTRPVIVGGIVATTAVFFMSFVPGLSVLCALLAVQGIGIGLAPATANTLIARSTRTTERALGFAAQSVPARANSFCLPLLLGFALELADLRAVFTVAAVITGLFTLVLARLAAKASEAQAAGAWLELKS
jgi:MFS family permease